MPIYGQFWHDNAPTHAEIEGDTAFFIDNLFSKPTRTGQSVALADAEILPPVFPSKIIAIGLNYADHAAEHGNEVPPQPLMWLKAPSSLLRHGGTIEVAFPDHRTDHESELAVVIGKRGKAISEAEALDYVLGFTPAQDVSDRVIQRGESQWARAKSLDTYTPLGPYIYTGADPSNLSVQCLVNGELRQDGHTRDLMFSVARIIAFVSQAMTLEAGDVILTGTPAGVSALRDGDRLETRIGDFEPLVNLVQFVK